MLYQLWKNSNHWEKEDPKLSQLRKNPITLTHLDEILDQIPLKPGIFTLMGSRQVGKSTLLRLFAKKALIKIKPENLVLLEGDTLENWKELWHTLESYLDTLDKNSLNAILVDEVSAIVDWHKAIKILADQGKLEKTILILTGSSAVSLKESGEFFPGRRGAHSKLNFEIFPASFKHISKHIRLEEYFILGGFPWAINEYLRLGTIPDYVGEIYFSWLRGEFLKRGKSELLLKHLLTALAKRLGTPFSHNTLAKEMGLSSNDTARQYLELLQNCYAIEELYWMNPFENEIAPKKNRKFYPIDPLLFHLFIQEGSLLGLHPKHALPAELAGKIAELVVFNELIRKKRCKGYFLGKKEIDFVPECIEVKYQNRVSLNEFSWFEKFSPKNQKLVVLTKNDHFKSEKIEGLPLKEWLLKN